MVALILKNWKIALAGVLLIVVGLLKIHIGVLQVDISELRYNNATLKANQSELLSAIDKQNYQISQDTIEYRNMLEERDRTKLIVLEMDAALGMALTKIRDQDIGDTCEEAIQWLQNTDDLLWQESLRF